MPPGEEKLTIVAEAKGTQQAAKEIDKVADAQKRVGDETKEASDKLEKSKRTFAKVGAAVGGLAVALRLFPELKNILGTVSRGFDRVRGAAASATRTFTGLVGALRSTFKAMRGVAAVSVILDSMRRTRQALRDEIALRTRLIGVMKKQADSANALQRTQRERKRTLEQVAGRRGIGGFATADIARGVSGGARRAQEQFEQLGEEDVALAFGTFGDLEFSQRDLTDLAIAASFGELKVDTGTRSRAALQQQGARTLQRVRSSGRTDIFRSRETVQGEGLGDAAFRTGRPTERAQELLGEARGPSGVSTEQLRERLKLVLPAGSSIERAVRFIQSSGSAEALEARRVGILSSRGAMAFRNRFIRNIPLVEVAETDSKGLVRGILSRAGLQTEFEKLPAAEFDAIIELFRNLERQGTVGRPSPQASNTTINITNNNQNAKFIGADASTQRRRVRNGESVASSLE